MRKKNILGTLALVFIGIVFGAVLVSGFGWVRPSYGDVKIGADNPPVAQLNADAAAFKSYSINCTDYSCIQSKELYGRTSGTVS